MRRAPQSATAMESAMNETAITEAETEDLQDEALDRNRADEGRICNPFCLSRRGEG